MANGPTREPHPEAGKFAARETWEAVVVGGRARRQGGCSAVARVGSAVTDPIAGRVPRDRRMGRATHRG